MNSGKFLRSMNNAELSKIADMVISTHPKHGDPEDLHV